MTLGHSYWYTDFIKELNSISERTWNKYHTANAWLCLRFMERWQNCVAETDEPFDEVRAALDDTCKLYGLRVAFRQKQAIFQSDLGDFTVAL